MNGVTAGDERWKNGIEQDIRDLQKDVKYALRWINFAIGGAVLVGAILGAAAGPLFSVAKAYIGGR